MFLEWAKDIPERGSWEARVDKEHGITAIMWKDTGPVQLLTSISGTAESTGVQRRQSGDGPKIISAPMAAELYNKYMTGVDKTPSHCSASAPVRRTA